MRIVDVNDLKIIRRLNKGTFSKVFVVEFDGINYCYKEFVHTYADDYSLVKLCDLTDKAFDYQFIVPLFMVYSSGRSLFTGYISSYDPNLVSIFNPFSREEKIKLLKSVRDNIEILHNDYNTVHGDLHLKNILCHKHLLETSILDFDFSQICGSAPSSFLNYGLAIQEYIKYFPFDYNADIYYFNLATFNLLAEVDESYKDTMDIIDKEQYYFSEMNKDVKRLTKELLLLNTRKPYSGEYIIDYIV